MAKRFGPDRGRKECNYEVRTKLRTHKVEIRFDRYSGEFFTQFNGSEFADPSIRGLEDSLLEKAETLDHVEWMRWIAYDLLMDSSTYMSGYDKYQGGDDRSFVGIEFQCVDLSVPQKGVARRYREREVDEGGNIEPIEDTLWLGMIWDKNSKLVPFSAERWVTLRQIRASIVDARKKLGELLDEDDSVEVACRIDSMTSTLLALGGNND